jgi:type I restriction enzyme, R subunit
MHCLSPLTFQTRLSQQGRNMVNQNPEQIARDEIDALLKKAGWFVQNKNKIDFSVGLGVAVREHQTDVGPADYVSSSR